MTICCWKITGKYIAEKITEYLKDKVFKHKYKIDLNIYFSIDQSCAFF